MRVTRRLHDVGLAAARGIALAGAACLLFAPPNPSALSTVAVAAAVMVFGAFAACCRKVFVDRSVIGTVCIWAALAVVFTDMLALSPRGSGLLPDQVLDAPLRFYGVLCSYALLLGLAELFLEAVQAHPGVSGRAALVGTLQGLVCAALILALVLLGTSTSHSLLGQAFQERFLSSVRAVSNAMIWGSCVLGCATVTLAVYCRRGQPVSDVVRTVGLVALLWGGVPAVVLLAWPSLAGVPRNLLPSSASMAPWYGLGFGVVFSLLWSFIHLHGRYPLPAVERVDPPRGRPVMVLLVLASLASLALQSQTATWVPLDDLQAGRAWVRPRTLTSAGDEQKVLFSPDSRTLWLGDRYGVRAGWRVDGGESRWRPTIDFREARVIRACSPEDATWHTAAQGVKARMMEVLDRSDARGLDVVDEADGSILAHVMCEGYRAYDDVLQAPSVRGDLVLGTAPTGAWVLHWRTGAWWGRDLEDWPTISPDGRLLLLRSARDVSCFELASGRRLTSYRVAGTERAAFDVTSRLIGITLLSGERFVLDAATGRVVPPPDVWADEARSPDGRLTARAEPWGVTLLESATGHRVATMYVRGLRSCVVAPDGRVNGDLASLEIVDDDLFIPVRADYPLYDVSLFPPMY